MKAKLKKRCDQGEASVTNGVFCHETGCINSRSRFDTESGEWIKQYTCRECGCSVDIGTPYCNFNDEIAED